MWAREKLKREYERTNWWKFETDSKELLAKGGKNLKVPTKWRNYRDANVIETMSYYSIGDTVSGRCSSYRVPKVADGGKV